MSQCRLIVLEWKVHQHIMVRYLDVQPVIARAGDRNRSGTHLGLLRELLHESPRLLARPRQVLRVLQVFAERVLADLSHAARDDVLDRLLYALPIADFVYELQFVRSVLLFCEPLRRALTLSRSLARPPSRWIYAICSLLNLTSTPLSCSFCLTNDSALGLSASERVMRLSGCEGSAAHTVQNIILATADMGAAYLSQASSRSLGSRSPRSHGRPQKV